MGEDKTGTILVVDDDPEMRTLMRRLLLEEGYECHSCETGEEALASVRRGSIVPDVVLVDLHLPDYHGVELLKQLRTCGVDVPCVVVTVESSAREAVLAMKNGAFDFLTKPFQPLESLHRSVWTALSHRRLELEKLSLEAQLDASRTQFVGTSQKMQDVLSMVDAVAKTSATVLITGATGTGKELVARMVHERSSRSSKKFVPINCGELAESVLESELFGHTKGAFTGANSARPGLFVSAKGGTLFLDEVGELETTMQTRLLRVLEDSKIRPLGSDQQKHVDVRIVAATNRSLRALVKEGEFREDLLYRLNVFEIRLPKLSERVEDIPALTAHLVKKHSVLLGRSSPEIPDRTIRALASYSWPGNVRQLENVLARALILCDDVLEDTYLNLESHARASVFPKKTSDAVPLSFQEAKQDFEQNYLLDLLERTGGNRAEAARLAHLDPSNFRRLLKRHQLI